MKIKLSFCFYALILVFGITCSHIGYGQSETNQLQTDLFLGVTKSPPSLPTSSILGLDINRG